MVDDLLYRDLVYKVQGVLFSVYKELGPAFKEAAYQKAIAHEFENQGITFDRERVFRISYKSEQVGVFRPDFVVEDKIILEIKAVAKMPKVFETQLFYYLKATNFKLGLLANFGCDGGVDIRRRIYDTARKTREI